MDRTDVYSETSKTLCDGEPVMLATPRTGYSRDIQRWQLDTQTFQEEDTCRQTLD